MLVCGLLLLVVESETFVIMKPLLIERVVTVLALNLWNYRMTLALMVGQTCLGQGMEGAAKVVVVQSSLRVNELLLVTTLLLIFTTPHCFLLLY